MRNFIVEEKLRRPTWSNRKMIGISISWSSSSNVHWVCTIDCFLFLQRKTVSSVMELGNFLLRMASTAAAAERFVYLVLRVLRFANIQFTSFFFSQAISTTTSKLATDKSWVCKKLNFCERNIGMQSQTSKPRGWKAWKKAELKSPQSIWGDGRQQKFHTEMKLHINALMAENVSGRFDRLEGKVSGSRASRN